MKEEREERKIKLNIIERTNRNKIELNSCES